MPKIKNRQKLLISNYKFFIFFLILFLLLFSIIFFKNNIEYFLLKNIQSKSESYGFILKEVKIIGIKRISREDIIKLFKEKFEKSIFLISLKELDLILSKIKWIESINMKKNYPSLIILDIKEKIPIAIYKNEYEKYFFIDINGEIINNVEFINDEKFIIITGNESKKNIKNLVNILDLYSDLKITSAKYISLRRWDLILEDKLKIKLPENKYDIALNNLNEILLNLKKFDYNLIDFIDLRVPEKAIIRFNNKENFELLNSE